ncbi:zinc-binding dehydrogenase [Streptomyces sp. NPDC026673]|uniref:alcohol dehydrogenase catalytic domain-containing protein n=1 Tax=Streptomyces sp. NPDC026673 TaxID=3155724 RepID=UPI003410D16C
MRALILTRSGEADGFTVEHLPDPQPAPGQIRIKMTGAAVNPVDLHVLDAWAGSTAGAVPARRTGLGMDVAGVVDMVGPGVRDFRPGIPVAALHVPHAPHAVAGAAAEYVIVPAAHAAAVPPGVDLLDAATVPLNSLTAAQLLGPLGPGHGRRLLVTGAAGGVGGYAVGLAARTGWAVTGLARASDAEFLGRAGAAATITHLEQATGFDAVLDAALLNSAALRAVRDHGTYVGVFPGLEPDAERGITITTGVVTPDGPQLSGMLELTAQGVLEARRAGTVPLEQAARAYQALRGGGGRGRWVLTP